jgi:N-acetylglucosamine kinase-like BadF-type ATPase
MNEPTPPDEPMGFLKTLNEFADYRDRASLSITEATVSVTEKYARRLLKIKKDEPLSYRGLTLKCIGSARWRLNNLS